MIDCVDFEEWKTIKEYPNYAVSNTGRVKRITSMAPTYIGKIIKPILKKDCGYLAVNLCRNNKVSQVLVQHLVCNAFLGSKPNKKVCNHKDGNKQNNKRSNLEYITRSEDCIHAINLGLKKPLRGSELNRAKLKETDIPEIFYFKELGYTQKQISKKYGVDPSTISLVLSRKNWGWLEL